MTEREAAAGGAERARGESKVVELSAAQQSFARRVAESKATAPHVYFEHALRRAPDQPALIVAVAVALRDVPLLNGAYRDGRVELHSRVNVAVGIEAGGTLAFPVVRDADRKDRAAIAAELEELGSGVGAGALGAPAFAGATFTVVDMSAAGVGAYVPVIARGQAATLGVGSDRLTLACDNRIVQGSEGADFLARAVELLEA